MENRKESEREREREREREKERETEREIVVWLFLTVPWVCLKFVIVLFPDHTHLLFVLYLLGVRV